MSQMNSNVNQNFVQPVTYPTQEVLRQNTIKNLMSALGLASAIPGQIAEGIQSAEQIDQQKTGQMAGSTTASGIQQRHLTFQEQEFIHDKIQQGEANLSDISSFAQARLNQSQYLESQNIIGFLKSLTPEQANELAKSPVAMHRQIASLVHTPESMLQFKHGLAEQASITDMGEIMRRFTTDQSKSPSQHAQDVMLERVQQANEQPGASAQNTTDELFGQDQEIQELYKASVAEKTFNLELAMTQKHAEQALANMAETSKFTFASNMLGALTNGTLEGKEGPKFIDNEVKRFRAVQKSINGDLSDQALDSMTFSLVGTTLKSLDARYGKALADRILDKLPNSKLAQYVKGNIYTEINQNLNNLQGENYSQVIAKATATYSPDDLRQLNSEMQSKLAQGYIRPSDYQKYLVEVEPQAQARVNSFMRTNSVAMDPQSSESLNKSDQGMIDFIATRTRTDNIASEPQLYSNLISHGGTNAITPTILGFINSYANSKDPQEFGHGMQVVQAMYKANPGATETLIRNKDISAKFSTAIVQNKNTGEDTGSFAARKWAVPDQDFELANDVITNPGAHNVALGDSLNTRMGNTLSEIKFSPENWRINQNVAKYLPNWVTGRPQEIPQSVQELGRSLYVDLFTDFKSRNIGLAEGDVNRAIMEKWAAKFKGEVHIAPFGANNTAVRLNGVGYAPGSTPTGTAGLYNNQPEVAAAAVDNLGILSSRLITQLAKERGIPENTFRAESDNVTQDKDGTWVLRILGDAPYNKPVAEVRFKDIKDVIKDNDEYLKKSETAVGDVVYAKRWQSVWSFLPDLFGGPEPLYRLQPDELTNMNIETGKKFLKVLGE